MEIRAFTISYSKQKAKMKKCPSSEAAEKYIKGKNELEKISSIC